MKSTQFAVAVWLSILILIGLPSQLYGQALLDAQTDTLLSLNELLVEVRTHNPVIHASYLEADALALRSQQIALPDPAIRIVYQPVGIVTARGTQRSQWGVEQQIPYPGKLKLQSSVADQTAKLKSFEAEALTDDLLLQVKHAYFTLYRIQEQKSRIIEFRKRLQNFEEIATKRYEVGTGVQQAILKIQLEINSLIQLQLKLSAEGYTATQILSRLANRPLSIDSRVAIEPSFIVDIDKATLIEIGSSQRPEVDALKTTAKRADDQLALAQKQFMPDFRFGITYFDIAPTGVSSVTGRDAIGVGASIEIPLQRSKRRAHIEEVRVLQNQIQVRQDALYSAIETEITDLIHQLKEESQQLELFTEALIPQAEIALQATLSSYSTGGTDFMDLLDSERMLFSLHMKYDEAFARYLLVTASLERALGVNSLIDLITE
ncbi:MAG: TolC family protein [Bacteroidetes bacterium]|nr:TolC family protein [Bacteroidota bacterium]